MGLYEENKKVYDVEYKKMKEEGYAFHPFATWKDITVGLVILLVLLALTFIKGVHLDPPADPTAQYLPRPEWYFMWLFQMLKYFPGPTAVIAVAIIPAVLGGAAVLLPFYDKNPYRSPSKRPVAVGIGLFLLLSIGGLTGLAYYEDAQHAAAAGHIATGHSAGGAESGQPAAAGEFDAAAFFANNCAMCHGKTGDNFPNTHLFDKKSMAGRDVKAILANGVAAKGMPSFGGRLKENEIDAMAEWLAKEAK